MSDADPCCLAAMGMASPLGSDLEGVWKRLISGDQQGFVERDDLVPGRSLQLATVSDPLPEIPPEFARYDCRNNQLTLAALGSIETAVRSAIADVSRARVGIVVGTSTSGVSDAEEAIAERARTGTLSRRFHYEQLEFGGASAFLAAYLEALGPVLTLSTACSSGARALASARSLLAMGACDVVVAGAVDSLCRLTSNGFSALQAVSRGITNPCSANRDGLSLGEAAALFLVTRSADGVQLVGVGESSEAHHMSAPDPNGRGAEVAMRNALRDAAREPREVAYLNLHGTGTPLNDKMECGAVDRVFGRSLSCSSTKPMVGHTLGTAGAIEAAFCWLMAARQGSDPVVVPPHCWDGEPDPDIPPIRLAEPGDVAGPGLLMSNSFGFGGNNCTLLLQAPAEAILAKPNIPVVVEPQRPMGAVVSGWTAWAPGLEAKEDWRRWAKQPVALGTDATPEARFIPAMLRRRCTPLSKIALTCAFQCCDDAVRESARSVFASRHGSVNESIAMVEGVAAGSKVSPAQFSHTVHNAQAGLFSLAAQNREASSSLSASENTFAMGWLEALGHLQRDPDRPVLYVMCDVPLSPIFEKLVDDPPPAYGVGLVLRAGGEGFSTTLSPKSAGAEPEGLAWPDAAEFLRWMLGEPGEKDVLELGPTESRWAWTRGA